MANIQKTPYELQNNCTDVLNEVGDYHDRLEQGLTEKRKDLLLEVNGKFKRALVVLNGQEEYLLSLLKDLEDEKITEIPKSLQTEPTVSSASCGQFRIDSERHSNCLPKILPFKAVAAEKTR
jgi:hypothetical protein